MAVKHTIYLPHVCIVYAYCLACSRLNLLSKPKKDIRTTEKGHKDK